MLVGSRMTPDPITVADDTPIDEALKAMREKNVRRLPVLNDKGDLVGIVAEKDILYASPSPATSLSIHEIHYLVSRIKVSEIMTKNVITVSDDTPLEEAARVMADNRIGALPVMHDGKLAGIITETDIFKIFLELLGARESGVRMTMKVPEGMGMLPLITGTISRLDGHVLALTAWAGEEPGTRIVTVKVSGVERDKLVNSVGELGIEYLDVRES
ncbi:MAG: CBS domain-containing protein [Anaerolineae bacterium]|nr:CBS domain-containing protein [Anaerolineae bacterium]NIN97281.1 CBS domain-containing protein [Anaerolineae bacterium]NIQ80211.1 CBS domain-containing protein [Anaerolineae bacterium]